MAAIRSPPTPAVFAFKHQSAWETLVLHLLLRDPAITLKRELTQIPLFGWYLTHAGMIRIDRAGGARALRTLIDDSRAALTRGAEIVIFPEGTRAPVGGRNPYHPGVAALYLHLECPVVPVALNSGVFWPRRSFIKRPGRIALEFLPPIGPGLDRKRFMAELEERLEGATERLIAEARPGRLAGRLLAPERNRPRRRVTIEATPTGRHRRCGEDAAPSRLRHRPRAA